MSKVLIGWMEKEFNISVNKTNIEKSFSNGYKIGKILNELELLRDIAKLKDENSDEAVDKNFDIINSNKKYALSDIEIKDIRSCEKGVVAAYLYSLLNYFNSKKVQESTTQNTQNMFKKYCMKSTGVYSDSSIDEYIKSGSYPVERNLRESERKFLEHRKKMEMDGYNKLMEIRENHARMLQTHRQKRLQIEREAKEYIINYNKDGVRTWKEVHGKLDDMESRDLKVELSIKEREERKRSKILYENETDMKESIECFEKNFKKLGVQPTDLKDRT